MSIFRKIIDFFIPLMPAIDRDEAVKSVTLDNISGDNAVLGDKTKAAQQYYMEERTRTKTIEGKASMFITSSGFLGTVLIGTTNILLSQPNVGVGYKLAMVVCLLAFVCYMVGTILHSLNALKRSTYSCPDASTVLDIADKSLFDKQTIVDLINSTSFNQNSTNIKMDYVVVAQRHFRRLMLSLLGFVLVLLVLVLENNGISLLGWFASFRDEVATWSFLLWYIIVSLLLIVASLIMAIYALVSINKLKKKIDN